MFCRTYSLLAVNQREALPECYLGNIFSVLDEVYNISVHSQFNLRALQTKLMNQRNVPEDNLLNVGGEYPVDLVRRLCDQEKYIDAMRVLDQFYATPMYYDSTINVTETLYEIETTLVKILLHSYS